MHDCVYYSVYMLKMYLQNEHSVKTEETKTKAYTASRATSRLLLDQSVEIDAVKGLAKAAAAAIVLRVLAKCALDTSSRLFARSHGVACSLHVSLQCGWAALPLQTDRGDLRQGQTRRGASLQQSRAYTVRQYRLALDATTTQQARIVE